MRAWAACGNKPQFLFFFNRLFPLFLKAQGVSKDIFVASVLLILITNLVQ